MNHYPSRFGVVILFFLISAGPLVSAATLQGEVYHGITLQTIKQTHITIGTNPPQLIITQEGRYSIALEPGTYSIRAEKIEQGTTTAIARESITIPTEGEYTYDLILFPPYAVTINEPLPSEAEIAPDIFASIQQPAGILLIIGIIVLAVEAAIIITRKNKAPVSEPPYQIMEINNMLPPLQKEERKKPIKKKNRQTRLTT